jgi:hypothetical protein
MSNARHHAEWLSLIEVSGPFLSMPVLLRAFPQGLDMVETEAARNLRLAYDEWTENVEAARPDPAIHNAWVRYVLSSGLEWLPEAIAEGPALSPDLKATMAEHGETLRPDLALRDPDTGSVKVLVQILPSTQGLEKPLKDHRWKASPATRMIELLHATNVRLGIITNGEQWMLVNAPRGETTGLASWYASLWGEEPITLRAFKSLLGLSRFFGVAAADTLESLLIESATDQQEVTDQLGYQVRRAVEVLVQRLDAIDRERGHRLLDGVSEKRLYEGALTVMMRLVFLFSAEEREMLLLGDPLYDQYYAVSTLRAQLRDTADRHGEEILERRRDAWTRLLSTFRLVYGGASHDRMSLPAYGGRLFDPDAYPFLEGRATGTRWEEIAAQPLPIDNRTVLHLLEALQILRVKVPGGGPAEPRRLSFRALDVEQIGHVYEGLLDHTALRATEPVVSLTGRKFQEPEVELARLEELQSKGEAALVEFLAKETGRSSSGIKKDLALPIDAFELQLFRTVCDNDDALLERVRPFAGLVRSDSFGYPVVISTGSVYVTQGSDRRETGTHYTPRSLTEPIVQHALDPLVYRGMADGVPPAPDTLISAREILDLKVCDMAMGSGAFLVQAVRYLSEKLVEAWQRIEDANAGTLVVTPEGDLSTGDPTEQPIPREPEERLAMARRIICDRCIYGVDINPMAVEMAKLSLWLTTMQKDRPFTFLDHALRCGDSLLGADVRQLSRWSLEPEEAGQEAQFSLLAEPIRWALDESTRLRRRIEATPVLTKADADYKAELLAQAEAAVALVELGGDLLCAAVLAPDDRERDRLRLDWGTRYSVMMTVADEQRKWPHIEAARADLQGDVDALRAEAEALLQGRRPLHWPLEFPEVFSDGRGGFDAFVGNPPFLGGKRITSALSPPYRDYLVDVIACGTRGNADLCSYFFLRAGNLVHIGGDTGLLATNTIAQGDTREVGLDELAKQGWTVYRAIPSRTWPGTALLEIAYVWMRLGSWAGKSILDEELVPGITSLLTAENTVLGKPQRLIANSKKSFMGSVVLGIGFILTIKEAQLLLDRNPSNYDVLFPYLNGDDLNSRADQSPSRWVINFRDWPLEQAEMYPDCLNIVRERVKPERDKLGLKNDSSAKTYARLWWQHARKAQDLYAQIAGSEKTLVIAQTSFTKYPARVPSKTVFDQKVIAFATSDSSWFALLCSNLHYWWTLTYASTMGVGGAPVYTPTDSFETFPFPTSMKSLEIIGNSYDFFRQSIMLARQEGLTKTYNRFHNPQETSDDIVHLRELHVDMDEAVAAAYGWSDLDLGHGFHTTKQGVRYTISEPARREVLDRLLALNHQRYADEVAAGLHDKGKKGSGGKGRGRGKKGQEAGLQAGMFD